MAGAALIEILSTIAPEAAGIVQKLQTAKMNTNQVLTALLALNLQQTKNTAMILDSLKKNEQAIRDVKADICDLKGNLTRKGSL
jgi:hypothetical protein